MDYVPINTDVTLSPQQTIRCVIVSVLDDAIPEFSESFSLSLTSTDTLVDVVGPFVITILDNDGK